jgi:L-lactate dehydrogenase complex protein LldG
MSEGAARILASVRSSLARGRLPAAAREHPGPFSGPAAVRTMDPDSLAERFADELRALSGSVYSATSDSHAAALVLEIIGRVGARRILAWDAEALGCTGLTEAMSEAGIEVRRYRLPRDPVARRRDLGELESIPVGLTGALGGLADSGAIALSTAPSRGRLASLLPPVHIALLRRRDLYPTLPAFLAANPGVGVEGSNLVFVCGPSRTADIEMTLSHGVHGPRETHVILIA